MKIVCLFAVLLLSLVTVMAQQPCPAEAVIRIGGTTSIQQLGQAWANAFMSKNSSKNHGDASFNSTSTSISTSTAKTASDDKCAIKGVEVGGFGWAAGGARVCGSHLIYDNVDIAGMYGPFFKPQADTKNGWSYDCSFSRRKTTLLHVGYEGIALVTASDSTASNCIQNHLGGGLSLDQMRWIFSSYTFEKLVEIGLNPKTVPNSDGDDSTHLWSELNKDCEPVEISIASVNFQSYANDFLNKYVLKRNGEIIRATAETEVDGGNATEVVQRTFSDLERAMGFLEDNGEAIALVQIGDLRSSAVQDSSDAITTIAVMDSSRGGKPFPPEAEYFASGDYLLSKSLHLGVWDDPGSLSLTKPLIQFGLSDEGTAILQNAGFWAIDDWEKIVMRTRLQTKTGIPMQEIFSSCGREDGLISIAGSSNVYPVARIWAEVYKSGCSTIDIDIEQGGSSVGAGRVCANRQKGTPADIGMMSREWKSSEGQPREGQEHMQNCVEGDQSLSAVMVDIAYDGLTIILKKGGIADECQELLGGFTVDQLRWIYSSLTEEQLVATGWDPSSLTNSDSDPSTHLWSELDPGCAQEEIALAGGLLDEGSHTTFRRATMSDAANGEDIDLERPLGYFQALGFELVSHVQSNGDAIAFIGFNFYHDNKELLSAAAIQNNAGVYVLPSSITIGDGTYNPLTRSISMNLLYDHQSLLDTVPLIKFGFSQPGLVEATGLVPLQGSSLEEMVFRLDRALAEAEAESEESSAIGQLSSTTWLGLVLAGWLLSAF